MEAEVSEDVVKELAKLLPSDGRQLLVRVLGWKDFDESVDLQRSIRLDCLYDCIVFCINRGFTWSEVCCIHNLVTEMIDAAQWRSLLAAITLYHTLSSNIIIDKRRLIVFTEFFFATFMTHYRLYQFVMASPPQRETLTSHLTLPVQGPPFPVPELCGGVEPEVWQYQEAVRQLERQEAELKEQRRREKFVQDKVDREWLETVKCDAQKLDTPVDTQTVLQIIQQVAEVHISVASHAIQQTINDTIDELHFKLEKSTLPRPHTLGAPPRYEPKSAITLPKGVDGGKSSVAALR